MNVKGWKVKVREEWYFLLLVTMTPDGSLEGRRWRVEVDGGLVRLFYDGYTEDPSEVVEGVEKFRSHGHLVARHLVRAVHTRICIQVNDLQIDGCRLGADDT